MTMLATDKAPTLFSPVQLGAVALRNRIVMAPMTRGRSGPTRVPNDLNLLYYSQRADHTGMIVTEATTVHESANGWSGSAGMYKPEHVEGWKKIVEAVHSKGCMICLQMWHIGRAGHSSFLEGKPIVAPSAIAINGEGVYAADFTKKPHEVPRALETDEVEEIVSWFGNCAKLCKEAGFDAVEVHGANGYLIDTFLQSSTNLRQDKYGGSVENRFRILDEILQAIFVHLPADRVGVRLGPNGNYNDMGSSDNIETFTYVLEQLAKKGLSYVHVMDGLAFGFHQKCDVFTLEMMKQVYKGNLICNCGYTRDSGEAALAAGHADAACFGRPFIMNPDLPQRFANDWPLVEGGDPRTWFGGDEEGYTTYPPYQA